MSSKSESLRKLSFFIEQIVLLPTPVVKDSFFSHLVATLFDKAENAVYSEKVDELGYKRKEKEDDECESLLKILVFLVEKVTEICNSLKSPDELVSVKSHAILLSAIELISSWGLYPLLFQTTMAFGKTLARENIKAEDMKAAASKWFSLRSLPKSLKLRADILWMGAHALINSNNSISATKQDCEITNMTGFIDLFYKALFTCATCTQYAVFLLERASQDMIYVNICRKDLREFEDLQKHIGLQITIASLLKLTWFQRQVMQLGIFSKERTDRSNAVVVARDIGAFLSSCVALPGGLNVILNEMIGHIPQGNLQAFVKVADLLTKPPRIDPAKYFESLSRQVVNLIKFTHSDANHRLKIVDSTALPRIRLAGVLIVSKMAENNKIPECKKCMRFRKDILQPLLMPQLKSTEDEISLVQLLKCSQYIYGFMDAAPPSVSLLEELELYISNELEKFIFASHFRCRGSGEAKSAVLLWLSKVNLQLGLEMIVNVAYKDSPVGTLINELGQDYLKLVRGDDMATFGKSYVKPEAAESDQTPIQINPTNFTQNKKIVELDITDVLPGAITKNKKKVNVIESVESAEEDSSADSDSEEDARVTEIKSIISSCNEELLCGLFAHSSARIASILRSENVIDADSLRRFHIDIRILQAFTQDVCGIASTKIDRDIKRKETLLDAILILLESSCSALGLWTFERDSSFQSTVSATITNSKFGLAPAGLIVAPICLALATSLASSDVVEDNQEVELNWRNCVKRLLPALAALSRANVNTAVLGCGGSTEPAVLKQAEAICVELSQTSLSIRMNIFTRDKKAQSNLQQKMLEKINALHISGPAKADGMEIPTIDPVGKFLKQCYSEIKSKEPAIRAMGIDHLRDLIAPLQQGTVFENGVPTVAPSKRHVDIVIENIIALLADDDPFVYLSCVKALAHISSKYSLDLIKKLTALYTDVQHNMDFRLRVGEALMFVVRKCGDSLPKYAESLIDTFIWGSSVRRTMSKKEETVSSVDSEGRYIEPQLREKLNPSDDIELALDIRFRTSSVSNLADTIALAPWAAIHQSHEIVSLVEGILMLERDNAADVRRAAAFALFKLVEGLNTLKNNDAIYNMPVELKEVLKLLKRCSEDDPDEVVVQHLLHALEVTNEMVKSYIFPYSDKGKKKELKVSLHLDRLDRL